jgi:hypothetical protein
MVIKLDGKEHIFELCEVLLCVHPRSLVGVRTMLGKAYGTTLSGIGNMLGNTLRI